MAKTMWKGKAESAEAQLAYVQAENVVLKERLALLEPERLKNASLVERLRLVRIAAESREGEKND